MFLLITNFSDHDFEFETFILYFFFKLAKFACHYVQLATRENKNFKDRNVFIILVPNKVVVQKAQEEQKKKDKSVAAEVSASV